MVITEAGEILSFIFPRAACGWGVCPQDKCYFLTRGCFLDLSAFANFLVYQQKGARKAGKNRNKNK
jgi:hypothetical protein